MPTTTNPVVTSEQGEVSHAKGNGFKINGREDWCNWSKFTPADAVFLPGVGDTVEVGFDKAGYVRACEVLSKAKPVERVNKATGEVTRSLPNAETYRIPNKLSCFNAALGYWTLYMAHDGAGLKEPLDVKDITNVADEIYAWATFVDDLP